MTETPKPSFFHTDAFNCWLITSFFTVFVSFVFAVLPVLGAHRLGVAVGDELSRYDAKPPKELEAPKPDLRRDAIEGIPVAYQLSRTGP